LNTPVINFLQKFQKKTLLGNVNLNLRFNTVNRLLKALSHILPSIDNINSIQGAKVTQLAGLHDANNDMAIAMLKARFLDIMW
jgi:hypothetical protein